MINSYRSYDVSTIRLYPPIKTTQQYYYISKKRNQGGYTDLMFQTPKVFVPYGITKSLYNKDYYLTLEISSQPTFVNFLQSFDKVVKNRFPKGMTIRSSVQSKNGNLLFRVKMTPDTLCYRKDKTMISRDNIEKNHLCVVIIQPGMLYINQNTIHCLWYAIQIQYIEPFIRIQKCLIDENEEIIQTAIQSTIQTQQGYHICPNCYYKSKLEGCNFSCEQGSTQGTNEDTSAMLEEDTSEYKQFHKMLSIGVQERGVVQKMTMLGYANEQIERMKNTYKKSPQSSQSSQSSQSPQSPQSTGKPPMRIGITSNMLQGIQLKKGKKRRRKKKPVKNHSITAALSGGLQRPPSLLDIVSTLRGLRKVTKKWKNKH